MTTVLIFVVGYVCGMVALVLVASPFVRNLQHELRVTQDRLYGAWSEGKVIPPRNDEPLELALPPLPKDLQAYVEEWESPESRVAVETTIRQMQSAGATAAQIHNHFTTERLRQSLG